MKPLLTYFYPNHLGRIILQAIEEILGHNEVNAVLNFACLPDYLSKYPDSGQDLKFPFEHISRIQAALESLYGSQAGRGLALRIGRACLKYVLREYGPDLGLTGMAFRLLPLPARLKAGTEALVDLFNRFTDQRVHLDVIKKQIYWQIERCPLCWERQSIDPCCSLAVGLLQETSYWISGGKFFQVEEKNCIACGDGECTIVIDQIPMS
jgi:predicted hydrocarbon binding protein